MVGMEPPDVVGHRMEITRRIILKASAVGVGAAVGLRGRATATTPRPATRGSRTLVLW
jgi:hypothetical protein